MATTTPSRASTWLKTTTTSSTSDRTLKFSATAFAMEGRVNFEDRMENVKFYGSNDGKTWTELTPEATQRATELTKIKVADNLADSTFRFLRVWKHGGGVLEVV